MKLNDFLKVKKVRAIRNYGQSLTEGKEYMISSVDYISVSDNDGDTACLDSDLFEPVLDSAENPRQGMELTPEFEALEPTFKVGDKVYFGISPKIQTIESVHAYNNIKFIGTWGCAYARQCCHATQENYERLQATFPAIEFEAPPKELTGSDLCRAMLEKGWKYVPCYVSDTSDDFAQKVKLMDLIIALDSDRSDEFVGNDAWHFAVPFDPRTGELLTQAVLDE